MTASSSHLQRTLHILLTLHISKVQVKIILLFIEYLASVNNERAKLPVPVIVPVS